MGDIIGIEKAFDDERILREEITPEEKQDIETKLLQMYISRAEKKKIPLEVLTDEERYKGLDEDGSLFSGERYYVLMDEKRENLLDMRPIAYHLLDTPEGNFYAKIMLHDEYLQP